MVVGVEVCLGVDCGFLGYVMDGCVGVEVVWCVGVYVAVQSHVHEGSPGPYGSGDDLYGVELRVLLDGRMRAP